ncbi:MAG: FHA domain-containing protein [Myxococcaceae bacterium]|nr:FHA domain-containing protein [Myxococcaceae bacterium]
MGFQLTVTRGAAAGESYTFAEEAKLGRTADNDVVVKDQAASRSHARVYEDGGKYFVEDLGSANGTRLNASPIKQPKELKSGDSIVIGDTVFKVTLELDETLAPEAAPSSTMDESGDEAPGDDDPNATRLPTRRAPPRRVEARPDSTNADEDEAPPDEAPADTGDEAASTGDEGGDVNSTMFVDVPRPKALARKSQSAAPAAQRPPRADAIERERPSRRGAAALARQDEADEPVELSAADRARMRRQLNQSATGRVQLLWSDLPKPARVLLGGFGALLVAGTLGFAAWVAWPTNVVNKPEPRAFRADGAPLEDSFGLGKVTFQTPDQKSFTFSATAPTRVVGVVHYQASNISTDEVNINLNGTDLGSVPADDIDPDSRELELVLPAALLKTKEENLMVFDNTRNPPGDDPWKIWNLWVEIIPVPDMSAEEARRRAQDEIGKAAKDYELREVGAANLFRAWKTYREAWLLLEATPDAPVELTTIARTRMKEIRPELDRKCNGMLVKFKTIVNTRPNAYEEGRQVLEHIPEYFPTREHPCHNFSKAMLRSIDGLDFEPAGEGE